MENKQEFILQLCQNRFQENDAKFKTINEMTSRRRKIVIYKRGQTALKRVHEGAFKCTFDNWHPFVTDCV